MSDDFPLWRLVCMQLEGNHDLATLMGELGSIAE